MSDRKDQGSRWSSAREREARDKQRKAQREEAKRARLEREANEQSSTSSFSGSGQRRLTDDERRTISEYRFPSASDQAKPDAGPPPPPPAPEATAPSLTSVRPSTSATSTKWRDSIAPPAGGGAGGTGLPDLPGDGGSDGKRPGNARLLIFGIALFAVMALVAFLPFGPFGGDDERDVPTPSATLPTILEPNAGGDADDPDTGQGDPIEQPVAGEGQAVVCIDPGHGGWDTGWNRTDQGDDPYSSPIVTEAEINLGMAYMLKADLEAEGMFVVLTRPSGGAVNLFDEDVNGDGETRLNAENTEQAGDRDELQARINVCNEANADILISLHINGFDDRDVRGYEIFYTAERDFGDQNVELSTLIYRQLDTALRDTEMSSLGRGANPDSSVDVVRHDVGTADNYIMTGPAVEAASIEPSEMPGTIVEAAFLSNDQDAAWIVQPENQQLVVRAYRDGIMDYFERYPPGS